MGPITRSRITPSIEGQAEDTKRVAESEAGRPLSVREVSAHFSRKAWRWIAANPGSAARLFARKVWYVLSGDEVPLNFCFPWYRERSLPLKLLVVGPSLLVPLGGAGLVLLLLGSGKLPKRLAAPWVVFAPVYVLAVAAFFAATRYRLPLFVPLAVGAGGAGAFVFGARRDRESRHLVAAGLVAALLAVPALWPTGLWDAAADEEMHLVLWEIERGDAGAMRHAETAASQHPDPALVWVAYRGVVRGGGKERRGDHGVLSFLRDRPEPPRNGAGSLVTSREAGAFAPPCRGRGGGSPRSRRGGPARRTRTRRRA